MSGAWIDSIFIAPAAGEPMRRVNEVEAIAGRGLAADRYALGTGYYCPQDVCEVTLIEGEVLDAIATDFGVEVHDGQHRRNIVTRGVRLRELAGKRLQIDAVLLEYDCPRPPCGYVERLTQRGMTRALGEGAGIAVRVLNSGLLRERAEIQVIQGAGTRPRYLP